MKAVKIVLSTLLCTVMMNGCTPEPRQELNVWVITDLHYLAEDLFAVDAPSFQKILESSGGKMIESMPEVMAEFQDMAVKAHPDAILIPGDITFNGEYESMTELKTIFRNLQKEGIQILVLPGNHDICYPDAGSFTGEGMFGVRNISQKEFTEQMRIFGYEQSLSHAPDSFSYTYALSDDLWIMAIDSNTESATGAVTPQTLVWMEEQLQNASEQNIHVITMSHQNVLRQSDYMYQGYVISNADVIVKMFEKYHVSLNLCGHAHLQHTATNGVLTDICTEAASIYPMGYGVLKIGEDHTHVEYTKAEFSGHQKEAEERLVDTIHGMVVNSLQQSEAPLEEHASMIAYGEEVNKQYFSGRLTDSTEFLNRREYQLWENYGKDTFFWQYLNAILTEFKPQ